MQNSKSSKVKMTEELSRNKSELNSVEQECSFLSRVLGGICKPDGSVNPMSISELIEYELKRSREISDELLNIRELDALVLEACSGLKEEIKLLRLRCEFHKMRTLDRFEHPCGEIFIHRNKH